MTTENSNIDKEKLISTVKKLLALAQSPNKAEAELAAQRAYELLEKYNLEMPADVKEDLSITEVVLKEGRTLKKWYQYLAMVVAEHYFCETVTGYNHNKTSYQLSLIGRPHNVTICRSIFDYIHKAILREARSIRKNAKTKYRDSFKYGMVSEIAQRLREKKKNSSRESNALVISESALIDEYLKSIGVKTVPFKNNSGNKQGFSRGLAAGRRVSLDDQLSSGCKQIGYNN